MTVVILFSCVVFIHILFFRMSFKHEISFSQMGQARFKHVCTNENYLEGMVRWVGHGKFWFVKEFCWYSKDFYKKFI